MFWRPEKSSPRAPAKSCWTPPPSKRPIWAADREEPLYRLIQEAAGQPRWNLSQVSQPKNTLSAGEYYDLLSGCASGFQLWETVYHHALPSHQALVDWVRSTRPRPYLNVLSQQDGQLFEEEILRRTAEFYPVQRDGRVLLRFRRLFFTAER